MFHAIAHGDKRYQHILESNPKERDRLIALLFGSSSANHRQTGQPRMDFGRPDGRLASLDDDLVYSRYVELKAALEKITAGSDALGTARDAFETQTDIVRMRLKGRCRKRHSIPGWNFSLDRVGDLHVCATTAKARTLPPYLIQCF